MFLLRFVKEGDKFAMAGGLHIGNVNPRNQTYWQNLKSVLFLIKENTQTISDFFTGDGFST